ncbi:FAD dependent pyridine nucleotide-disulfide oxidoreductase family protein [Gottschalkia acidurici 9a]|uniref:FAD dependent pyridine nucleotide-disulfide oxidoreductase family protein n=2 Tax=Clostridium acidurici TaxID=1556 RepID=K0AUX6_GOTA9|nr:FAD dependent pyridine nucleotide-disulfide oxidoreductase family protein [Gottschalkia acidurici 9a]
MYDAIIVGAGPSGIFTAYELIKNNKDLKVLMIEKGRSIEKRICPKRKLGRCVECKPCSITTGFAGAGAYSDGKLSLSPDVGGTLPDILGYDKAQDLINEADKIYLSFEADSNVYGLDNQERINAIKKKAIEASLKLIDCPVRHLGTEEGYRIYSELQKHLLNQGVEILFDTMVEELIIENGEIKGVVAKRGKEETKTYNSDKVVVAIGREGAGWFREVCKSNKINVKVGTVDIGVRVEVRDEIMKEINETLYESKLVYYTPTFDDKVRVFCSNPSGEVATEYYDDGLAVVNGHAYKSDDMKTNNTNFALLVSKEFTEPFEEPIEYGKHIAKLGNMLSGGKILVQRYGDFKRGRRTTEERLRRNNIHHTLKDSVPGDLSLVLPYRIMKDLEEMIEALDKVVPGMASDETLMYGVEVKFYSSKVVVDDKFETEIKGLYAVGDGAGITRGLQQASANGLQVARNILGK